MSRGLRLSDEGKEQFDEVRIECISLHRLEDNYGFLGSIPFAVGTVGDERVVNVDDRNDPCFQRDIRASDAGGITGAVVPLVMMSGRLWLISLSAR